MFVLLATLTALLLWRRRGVGLDVGEELVGVFPIEDIEEREPEQIVKKDKQQQIIDMYQKSPDKIAEIIKVWMKE
ncbi:MAG: hypothetical protein RQM92_02565 [Candidatus Syntrophopropionicum ammoniitolerans]